MTPDEIQKDREAGTSGPWCVGPVDDTVVIAPDGSEVAAIDGDYNEPDLWPVMEANARRIARLPDLEQAYLDLTAENAALKERVAELEAVMTPFAKRADTYDPPENDDGDTDWHDHNRLLIGDLRRARAALQENGD